MAMGRASSKEDRLNGLPDDVLHSILLPLKHAVRTSALSTRWAHKWLHALSASAVLDFTDRDFVRGQSAALITSTVDRVLKIHGAAPINVLRVVLTPLDALGRDIVIGWVSAALGRGAREVGVDLGRRGVLDDGEGRASLLQLPRDLFQVENSLSVLSLGRCSLRDVPPGAAGIAGLTSLSLDRVDVTDDAVRDVVLQCQLLEFLSLRNCHLLVSVRVAGERLRCLEIVGCLAMRDLQLPAARDDSHNACSGAAATGEDADIVLDYEIALDHLTFVKVVNFRGTTRELRLLRFVLRRAPVLEQLVLVTPEEEETLGDYEKSVSLLLKIAQEHVSQIRKAWLWQDPHVTVCRPREDDSRSPAHTKYYHDDQDQFS